jgi:hypothetical protein
VEHDMFGNVCIEKSSNRVRRNDRFERDLTSLLRVSVVYQTKPLSLKEAPMFRPCSLIAQI